MKKISKNFVIGIGGTGMRCIEALIHLCAIGMLDGQELNILILDTDINNGNKSRTENLIDTYHKVKGGKSAQKTSDNSLFSAKINLFRFSPDYTGRQRNFKEISKLDQGDDELVEINHDLADLLFSEPVQAFPLEYGYRAQTHLGSHLMYHGILDSIRKEDSPDLTQFLRELLQADQNREAKVFIMGSIFGGTGASSIPIVPQALRNAMRILSQGLDLSGETQFGCSLMTHYFRFNTPDQEQLYENKVVADANNFALNCKSALMFYESDPTVRSTYNRMYLIGWPQGAFDYDKESPEKPVRIGGNNQKNPAHVVEMMTAFAALDFFEGDFLDKKQEIVYRSVKHNGQRYNFNFTDFAGENENLKRFQNKLGAMYGLAFLVNYKGFGGDLDSFLRYLKAQWGKEMDTDYGPIPEEQKKAINDYLRYFAFYIEDGAVSPGWIRHLQDSSGMDNFLFSAPSFSDNTHELLQFDWGKLFENPDFQFTPIPKFLRKPKPLDDFVSQFIKEKPDTNLGNLGEKFLNQLYKTFTTLHKIIHLN